MRTMATILHADLDAFYASVEQLLDPRLRGQAIAVGGGVVLAASYEAKAFGVKGGMSGVAAKRLCPHLQFVDGHFREYQRIADQVMEVFRDVTPLVERISIDEAFLDVAGSARLFGAPRTIAEAIRKRVSTEIGLPISIGIATTKHLAKVASQVAKPDGLVEVEAGSERSFLNPLPIGLVWGVGPATEARLHACGITTIGQLANAEPSYIGHLLGSGVAAHVHARATNDDERRVVRERRSRSVGSQSACGRQTPTDEFLRASLGHLADRVAGRLRRAGQAGRTITVRVRFADMRAVTRSRTLPSPIATTRTLEEVAESLVRDALADHHTERVVSLLGISVSGLTAQAVLQLELPFGDTNLDDPTRPGSPSGSTRWAVDQAMDRVRLRFGSDAVGYLSTALSDHARVSDEFRELAEHPLAAQLDGSAPKRSATSSNRTPPRSENREEHDEGHHEEQDIGWFTEEQHGPGDAENWLE